MNTSKGVFFNDLIQAIGLTNVLKPTTHPDSSADHLSQNDPSSTLKEIHTMRKNCLRGQKLCFYLAFLFFGLAFSVIVLLLLQF